MNYFKVSYLLKNQDIPPFVLGSFVSRSIIEENYISTEASFKASKFSSIELSSYKQSYLDKLNNISFPFVWELVNTSEDVFKAKLRIENDLALTKERFFYKLYYSIITNFPWLSDNELNDQKKYFIRGFIEPRGSVDTTASYISQDYYYDDLFETKKYKILTDFCNVPYYVLNLNFRNLQRQYYEGINQRNTQFRVNSKWYMKHIGMLNDYKIDIFANCHSTSDRIVKEDLISYFNLEEPRYNLRTGVDDRFNFYVHNILHRDLTDQEINSLRQNLGYDSQTQQLRDSSLPELVRFLEPDECVCCKNLYNINDRTFTHKRTNRPYFEIHHVISLGNNRELDDENNLVKLCPVCHTCLKRGTGLESDQKRLISLILENSSKVLSFSENIFDCDNRDILIDKIYSNLK